MLCTEISEKDTAKKATPDVFIFYFSMQKEEDKVRKNLSFSGFPFPAEESLEKKRFMDLKRQPT